MTSKIKVDNIENQCGGAVVTKCGATTTISGSVVKADDIQAADGGNIINQCGTTITLGASGDTINLASGASQTGFGRTGTVDWDTTPKTASFTAVSGDGYFVNTTSGAITVTLPAGTANAIVSLADYAATWQTNNVTVTPNGSDKIGGENENAILSTEGQSVTFVFVDSTQGWVNTMDSTSNVRGAPPFIVATGGTETTCGDFKIHTFTGPGTFTVSGIAPGPSGNPNSMDYLVVAGGGGANISYAGGGAGGFRYSAATYTSPTCAPGHPLRSPTGLTATVTSFPITVGSGGAGGPGPSMTPGGVSTFSTITSAGGGRGGNINTPVAPSEMNGGSGGGGHTGACTSTSPGGAGNTPPVSPPQGNNGGSGQQQGGVGDVGGGGGGATAVGSNGALPGSGGNGGAGAGLPNAFGTSGENCGSFYYFSGGGGANSNSSPGSGGIGGGGDGCGPSRTQTAGATNTGGGGGGGPSAPATNGGSGIVIIRYKFQ